MSLAEREQEGTWKLKGLKWETGKDVGRQGEDGGNRPQGSKGCGVREERRQSRGMGSRHATFLSSEKPKTNGHTFWSLEHKSRGKY